MQILYEAIQIGSQPLKTDAGNLILRQRNSLLQAYFPGLNELRALAALAVILSHIEQMKEMAGLPFRYWFPLPGKLGVILFFALSGFLITSILIREKTSPSDGINLSRFYLKRVLRIWPLYFLVVGISLLLLNRLAIFEVPPFSALAYNRLDLKNILLLLCILPNYVEVLIPYLTQIWSIGIEEQFYLFQPCLVKYLRSDGAIAAMMLAVLFMKEILLLVNRAAGLPLLHDIANQSVYTGCIAIGCLGALACRNYPEMVRKILHHPLIQILSLLLLLSGLTLISVYKDVAIIDYRVFAMVFAIMIINAATNSDSCFNLNCRPLDYLGKISYGLYMFHEFGIGATIALIRQFSHLVHNYITLQIAVYGLSLTFTLLLSALSFRYFEGFFLGLKEKLPR